MRRLAACIVVVVFVAAPAGAAASIPGNLHSQVVVPVPDAPASASKALPEFSVNVQPAQEDATCDGPTCAFVPKNFKKDRPVLVVYLEDKLIVVVRCSVDTDGSGLTNFKFYDTDSWSESLVDPDSAWKIRLAERLVWIQHCDHLCEVRWKERPW